MLVVLYTWIVSCTDQMRFFSMRDRPFFLSGPSFPGSYLLVPVLFFSGKMCFRVLDSCCSSCFVRLCFHVLVSCCTCSPRCRVRDNQCRFRSNRQCNSALLLFFASRSELLGNELFSWIPTASAVRCYTAMQALNDFCGSLLSCQRSCCTSC